MTRKEAIMVLSMVEAHGQLSIEAKEMAIEALAQPEVIRRDDCKYAKSVDSEYWIRCRLTGSYELREWYCGSARRCEK